MQNEKLNVPLVLFFLLFNSFSSLFGFFDILHEPNSLPVKMATAKKKKKKTCKSVKGRKRIFVTLFCAILNYILFSTLPLLSFSFSFLPFFSCEYSSGVAYILFFNLYIKFFCTMLEVLHISYKECSSKRGICINDA